MGPRQWKGPFRKGAALLISGGTLAMNRTTLKPNAGVDPPGHPTFVALTALPLARFSEKGLAKGRSLVSAPNAPDLLRNMACLRFTARAGLTRSRGRKRPRWIRDASC